MSSFKLHLIEIEHQCIIPHNFDDYFFNMESQLIGMDDSQPIDTHFESQSNSVESLSQISSSIQVQDGAISFVSQMIEVEIDDQKISSQKSFVRSEGKKVQSTDQKSLNHVRCSRKRIKKGFQKKTSGYHSKNFLQYGKKPHFDFLIANSKDKNWKTKYPEAYEIFKVKKGITMEDYVVLYSIPSFRKIWEKFFHHKILFRELMLSRTQPQYKLVYLDLMRKFEEAFQSKEFKGVSRQIQGSRKQSY